LSLPHRGSTNSTFPNPLGAFDQAQSYIADITLFLGALSWVIYTSGASLFPTWSPYRYTAMTALLGLVSV
jgi:hypothetical protein